MSNPTKKQKKIQKKAKMNDNLNKQYLITKNPRIKSKLNNPSKYVINLNGVDIELNEEQIYEMNLRINKSIHKELNNLSYEKALKKDNRTFCSFYLSLIISKHLLFFSFLPTLDYNSRIIKIFLFFFNFSCNFAVNALFFDDDSIHKIYKDGGEFDFVYNIPQILYSAVLSGLIDAIIKIFALSDSKFLELKKYNKKRY